MSSNLRLGVRINLIVGLLIALMLTGAILANVSQTTASICEEATAANRATLKRLERVRVTSSTGEEPQALKRFFAELGRVRALQIRLFDQHGKQPYASPPPLHKASPEAPG